ncbi:ATP-binding protein [Nocardia paucivorans]|uniref:ATP-binding protein n=1 Tax=Nocardia paucivorans TaxID=114259 RepID=UPI0002FDF03E|nr:anti-sigma factor [Nocardia paucivorans]
MGKGENVFPSSSAQTNTIGVRVPAVYEQLVMLRALAETVALIADFGLDEVADMRLALDEVATALLQDAAPDSELDCAFAYDESSMDVTVSAVTVSAAGPDEDSFGWHIVSTLTDRISTTIGSHDPAAGGYPTVVRFRWSRAGKP